MALMIIGTYNNGLDNMIQQRGSFKLGKLALLYRLGQVVCDYSWCRPRATLLHTLCCLVRYAN